MLSQKLKTGRDAEICPVCNSLIRPPGLFCEHCGPPVPPPEQIPESLKFSQALFRILILVLLFSGAIYYKTGADISGDVNKIITKIKTQIPGEAPPATKPVQPDYKLIHAVNVPKANIREKPTTKSDVVGVAARGEVLKVLQKNDAWSQVQLKDRTGWIASRLLDSRVE